MLELNRIYNEDCLIGLKQLDDKSIDCVITDPPYNISKDNNFATLKNAKRQGLDFGEWDKNFNLFAWLDSADKLLKYGGNIIIFNSFLNIGDIAKYLENKDYAIKDLIRWVKPNPMPRNMNSRFVSDYELAIWCVKGKKKKWVFNNATDSYIRPEIKCSSPSGKERIGHPTQKPLYLMEELVKIFTNENDIILDPFMGSGTTAITCMNMNRKFIGFELDKTYFDLANKRIEDNQRQIKLL